MYKDKHKLLGQLREALAVSNISSENQRNCTFTGGVGFNKKRLILTINNLLYFTDHLDDN